MSNEGAGSASSVGSASGSSGGSAVASVTGGGAGGSGGSAGTPTASTTINSMDDLKNKAPQVYNAMVLSIAMNICNDMQHAQDRLKKKMREGEQTT